MAAKKAGTKKQDADSSETADTSIRVRATRVGIYGHVRRREGDEFTIAKPEDLGTWMEPLDVIEAPAPTEGPKE